MPVLSEPSSTEAAPPAAERTAIPESLQEGWSSPNEWKIHLARLAYRHRAVPWVLAWASAAGAATMAACKWIGPVGQYCPPVLPGWWWAGFAGWLGVWLISAAFIVAVSGWFGVRFRYVAWGAANLCGTAARALRAHWRVLLLMSFFVFLIQVDEKLEALSKILSSDWNLLPVVLIALAVIFLIPLLWGAFQGRSRIILQEIKNHTGRPELEACAKGLSDRLCGELAGLAQLYGLINRSQGSRSKGNVYRPSIDIQDTGALLENAVSAQATLDLKLFKVPIGAVLALGSRLLRGARLAGSLHEYHGQLLLVAQMTGAGREGGATWRVAAADLDEEDRDLSLPLVLDRMIKQLACRIAADLVSVGSRKWRAVHHFTEGLRAYRSSQGTKNEKLLLLHEAERSFLEALSEDEEFAQCHYNLGIVYGGMERGEAADAAFRRALQDAAEPSGACYALAVRYFSDDRFPDALWFSKNAIRIRPDDPNAWHLKAMSLYYGRVKPETKEGKPGPPKDWEASLEAEALAVGIAWRDFCRWRMKGRLADRAEAGLSPSGDHRQTAAGFTRSLANGFLLRDFTERRGKDGKEGPVAGEGRKPAGRGLAWWKGRRTPGQRRAWKLIRQSARLAPDDSENYFSWAKVLWKTGDVSGAAQMLDRVFAGRLEQDDRIDFWSMLLAVHAALTILRSAEPEDRDIARDACDYLLDAIAARDPGPVEGLVKPLEEARDRLEQALAWATAGGDGEAGAQRSHLEHLLEELTWRMGEAPVDYIRRLPLVLSDPAAEPASYLWRLRNLLLFVKKLKAARQIRPSEEPRWPEPWRMEMWEPCLQADLEALDWAGLSPSDEKEPSFGPLHFFQMQRRDWEWACAQISVRHGLEHLKEEHPQADSARRCFADALASIDKRTHCHQIVDQCLRSRLAEACLLEARVARKKGDLDRWTKLLRQGVTEAEKAVALEPAGYEEHKVLGRLYFELGDYQRAEEEWKVCFVVHPDPEVLNLRAEAVWRRGLELAEAEARRQAFTGAVKMFEEARELIEKNPSSSPEDHGESHFWLGVFHRELLEFDQAIFNHKIAWSLGVRPLEARTSLAWAYLEAKMYGEALATFQAVWKEAHRQLAGRTKPVEPDLAAEPGQEMPLDEIVLRILLGLALHDAELGVRLGQAENLIRYVLRYARGVRSYKRAELLARCWECLGLIRLQRYELEKSSSADLETAIHHLRRALQLHARCDTYLLLARAHLNRAKAVQRSPRKEEMEAARQDCERARRADLRGRRDGEIKDLLRQIGEDDKAAPPVTAELRRVESAGRSKPAEAA